MVKRKNIEDELSKYAFVDYLLSSEDVMRFVCKNSEQYQELKLSNSGKKIDFNQFMKLREYMI